MNKIIRNIVLAVGMILFIYLMIVLNAYKITKEIEFNIFKYEGISKIIVFVFICIPLAILLGSIFERLKGNPVRETDKNITN